jgi:hypothetical protein
MEDEMGGVYSVKKTGEMLSGKHYRVFFILERLWTRRITLK